MALFDQLKGDGLQSETYRANFHTALDALYASEEEQHAESSSDDGLPTIAKAVAGAGMLCRGSPSTPATASASAGVKPATKKRNVAAKSSTGKGKNVGTPSETNTSVEGKKRATPRGPRKTSEVPPLTLRDVLTAEDLSQLSSDNSEESDAQVYTIQPALPMGMA